MAYKEVSQTLTPEEARKRLSRASNVIDLGAGSLLGSSSSNFTDDEAERSLQRLLERVRGNSD